MGRNRLKIGIYRYKAEPSQVRGYSWRMLRLTEKQATESMLAFTGGWTDVDSMFEPDTKEFYARDKPW